MPSPASRIPSAIASLAVAVALVAGSPRAWAEAAASSPETSSEAQMADMMRSPNPFGNHFPNVVLKAHTGRNVRFYDDLLKDKIVLINFMYATCTER